MSRHVYLWPLAAGVLNFWAAAAHPGDWFSAFNLLAGLLCLAVAWSIVRRRRVGDLPGWASKYPRTGLWCPECRRLVHHHEVLLDGYLHSRCRTRLVLGPPAAEEAPGRSGGRARALLARRRDARRTSGREERP